MPALAGFIREFLGRYVANISKRIEFRPNRREWQLLSRKLSLDFDERTITQQTFEPKNKYAIWNNDSFGSVREIRNRRNNIIVSPKSQLSRRYVVHKTRFHEQVYDLINAGPNHCFTVWSNFGAMLVHNCVQAISRDCLAFAIERLEQAGFPIVFHVHDEVIIDCPKEKADLDKVVEIMTAPLDWAEGLPINADGWIGEFFRKD